MKRIEKTISLISKMNKKDLKTIQSAMRERWSYLTSLECLAFQKGDKVTYKNMNKQTVHGKVLKVARKSVIVETEKGKTWRISPRLLRKVKK